MSPTAQKKRLLIVEDDEDIRDAVAEILEGEGYEVARAVNGVQALSWLSSTRKRPHLILLDLMMPEMDGYEFRARQRSDTALSGIPVLLMTAAGDTQAKAEELGARSVLKKPFEDIETIVEVVARSLD